MEETELECPSLETDDNEENLSDDGLELDLDYTEDIDEEEDRQLNGSYYSSFVVKHPLNLEIVFIFSVFPDLALVTDLVGDPTCN